MVVTVVMTVMVVVVTFCHDDQCERGLLAEFQRFSLKTVTLLLLLIDQLIKNPTIADGLQCP